MQTRRPTHRGNAPTGGSLLLRPRFLATALGILAAAVLAPTPAVASGEPPIEAHLVTPEAAEVRTHPTEGPFHADHGSFLDGIEGLDVHRQGGALGLVQRDGNRVLITAVRLRNEDEAALALTAFGNRSSDAATIEVLPEIAPDTITQRIKEQTLGIETTLIEVTRATGRDLVVFAQLDLHQPGLTPFTREVVDVHLGAFPAVTPPAAGGPDLSSWLLPAGSALGVVMTALSVAARRRRRQSTLPATPPSTEPSRVRVNW